MQRGDICIIDLDPARGSEAGKSGPAVIVSNEGANVTATRLGRGVVTVVPVTSNTAKLYAFQVFLPATDTGLTVDSKAQAEQARSVDVTRVGDCIGAVPGALMNQLDKALRVHLGL